MEALAIWGQTLAARSAAFQISASDIDGSPQKASPHRMASMFCRYRLSLFSNRHLLSHLRICFPFFVHHHRPTLNLLRGVGITYNDRMVAAFVFNSFSTTPTLTHFDNAFDAGNKGHAGTSMPSFFMLSTQAPAIAVTTELTPVPT